ncbi:MAG: aminotransferase class V-fold PLP-dependent enzyme [Planctomycetota bacterium]|nr:aminotransferase class V-fold PLP-dependent enzyme [Planctomycetota bacterium]
MSNHAANWDLEPGLVFLNHGSFGAAPRCVLEEQARLHAELEASPVRFLYRELEPRLDAARDRLAGLLGADPAGLVFVPNATTGVNTALAVLTGQCDDGDGPDGPAEAQVGPGDEVLILDPEYNATANAVRFAASRVGATVRVVPVPFPLGDAGEVTERVLAAVTKQTRLFVIDHIVSQTGLVLPIEEIIPELRERGIETLVDGAHGPGHLPLSLDDLGAAFYTGNCHKWLCTPKGSAMLHVRADWRGRTRPLVISHGANATRKDRSRLHLEFDWPGTFDPTPYLVLPTAIDFLEGLFPGGIGELQLRNRELTVEAQGLLCEALGIERPAPADMLGALASIPLPAYPASRQAPPIQRGPLDLDPLHVWLHDERRIEVPVFPLGKQTILRTSAQAYNEPEDYAQLAAALGDWYAG